MLARALREPAGAVGALALHPEVLAAGERQGTREGVPGAAGDVLRGAHARPVARPASGVPAPELPALARAPGRILGDADGDGARVGAVVGARVGAAVAGGVVRVRGAVVVAVPILVGGDREAAAARGEHTVLVLHQVEAEAVAVERVGAHRLVHAVEVLQDGPVVVAAVGAGVALTGVERTGVPEEDLDGIGEEEAHLAEAQALRPVDLRVEPLDGQVLGTVVVLAVGAAEAPTHQEGVHEGGHDPLVHVDEVPVGDDAVGGVGDEVAVEVRGGGLGGVGVRIRIGVRVAVGVGIRVGVGVRVGLGRRGRGVDRLRRLADAGGRGGDEGEEEKGLGVHVELHLGIARIAGLRRFASC